MYEQNRYSPAIRSNGFLFVSGQVGSLEDGSPQQGLKAQVRQAFENLNAILTEAGCSFDDVIDVTVFMVDPASTFEEIWEVVPEYWGDAPGKIAGGCVQPVRQQDSHSCLAAISCPVSQYRAASWGE
nr:endoribonuclease L-PSP [uncultured bacterium]